MFKLPQKLPPQISQTCWFIFLWLAGVITVAAGAYGLRWLTYLFYG
jgi:hypothetical protein